MGQPERIASKSLRGRRSGLSELRRSYAVLLHLDVEGLVVGSEEPSGLALISPEKRYSLPVGDFLFRRSSASGLDLGRSIRGRTPTGYSYQSVQTPHPLENGQRLAGYVGYS